MEEVLKKATNSCKYAIKTDYPDFLGVHMLVSLAKTGGWTADAAFLDGLAKEVTAWSDDTKDRKPRYLLELLTLVGVVAGSEGGKEKGSEWSGLLEALKGVRGKVPSNRKFRDVKKAFNKTCVPLGIPALTAADMG